ncbi:MAG: DNA-3-methyladenine glycosylase [Gemmatimonadales bacterium]
MRMIDAVGGWGRAGHHALPARFFHRPADVVARALIGTVLVSRRRGALTAGRIVETEAYLGAGDPASHAYNFRRHAQNGSVYAPPGTWYIYRSYGIHWCCDLTASGPAPGSAVLIRAIEPLDGLSIMRRRRGGVPDARLADGPGKVCQALGIDQSLDGIVMAGSWAVVLTSRWREEVAATPRIGISKAVDWPLRFVAAGSRASLKRTARRSETGGR